MHELDSRDTFDRVIDAALTTYADAGSDLECRVLARAEEARRGTRARRGLIAGSGLALAASILLLFELNTRLAQTPHTMSPQQHSAAAATPAVAVKPAQPFVLTAKPVRIMRTPHLRMRINPAAPPRLPVFPTPAPLTAEERTLVRLATETTSEARKNLLGAQQQAAEPLHIASIAIPPIEPPAEGKE